MLPQNVLIILAATSLMLINPAVAADFKGAKVSANPMKQVLKDHKKKPYKPTNEKGTADDVEERLGNYRDGQKWADSLTPGKFRIFSVETYSFPLKNPKRARNFALQRAIAATAVQLKAKAQIITGIRSEMSAMDQISMPGTPVHDQLNAEYIDLTDRLAEIREEASTVLKSANKAEQDLLGDSANWQDRSAAFADALIKKLNSDYDTSKIKTGKAKKAKELADKLKAFKAEQKALELKAKKLKSEITEESTSTVASLSQMPLYGILILATEESWDPKDKMYTVGILSVWSQKHEERTRALLSGDFSGVPDSGTDLELREWLKKQSLVNMVGANNFTDSQGVRWIIGGAMRRVNRGNRNVARAKAKLWSRKEVAMALFSDVESKENAEVASKTRNVDALKGETEQQAVESYSKTQRSSFENRNVSGIFFIKGKTIKHPFTGKKVYVAISATSSLSNRAAYQIEKINYQTNQKDISSQQYQKGVKEGYKAKRREAERDPSAFKAGVRDAAGAIKREAPNRLQSAPRQSTPRQGSGSQGGHDPASSYSAGSRSGVKSKDF